MFGHMISIKIENANLAEDAFHLLQRHVLVQGKHLSQASDDVG